MLHFFDMAERENKVEWEQTTGTGIGLEPESGAEDRVGRNRILDNLLHVLY
jgi:hypothetical protein